MLTVSQYYKKLFNTKVYKISLDAGCTCPNRDGTAGKGGCIFCSANGSGDFLPSENLSIPEQITQAKKIVASKIKSPVKYIAYFQNFTNTYGNIEELKQKWHEALMQQDIVGLAIATRPDCITPQVLEAFKDLSSKTFLQVELGLQTSCHKTAELINRCYKNKVYKTAVKQIREASPGIHVVTHIIFGLPGEKPYHMLKTVRFACRYGTDGIKITVLYVLKNTKLQKMYENGTYVPLEQDQYFSLLRRALKILPKNIIIHRLTGDPPKSLLVAPQWPTNKKLVLTKINNLINGDR